MRRAASLSILLWLLLPGCKDSDETSSKPSASSPGSAVKAIEALSKTPLTAGDVEKFLSLYPAWRHNKTTEDHKAAAAAQGLQYQEAVLLMSRVTSAFVTLQMKGQSMPMKAPAADVEVVRPYEARIKAVMK